MVALVVFIILSKARSRPEFVVFCATKLDKLSRNSLSDQAQLLTNKYHKVILLD